jgi:hypothetical protein
MGPYQPTMANSSCCDAESTPQKGKEQRGSMGKSTNSEFVGLQQGDLERQKQVRARGNDDRG